MKYAILFVLFGIGNQALAGVSCSSFLKTTVNPYIGTLVTVSAHSVNMDIRADIPGQFNVHIFRPIEMHKLSLKGYFKTVDLELRFMHLRHPKSPNLSDYSVSGVVESVGGELAIVFDRIWKKDPRLLADRKDGIVVVFSGTQNE